MLGMGLGNEAGLVALSSGYLIFNFNLHVCHFQYTTLKS